MDTKSPIASMIRVNHAGEYGAHLIYETQKAFLQKRLSPDHPIFETLEHMAAQEKEHLKYFSQAMVKEGVRPTVFQPVWYCGARFLGAVTALLGEKAVHACTMAIEDVIEGHYQKQIETLDSPSFVHPIPKGFKESIKQFQEEECAHKEIAQEQGGAEAPGFPLLYTAIQTLSRTAIWLSTRW